MAVSPLTDTEAIVWRALMVLWRQGLPTLDQTFRRVGLNHLEYGMLAVLAEQPKGSMRAGELAHLAGITSSRLAHRLKELESRGDVVREPDSYDRRSVIVAVTEQGRTKVESVYADHLADVRRLVFDHLTPDQTVALADALSAVSAPLNTRGFLPA